MFRVLAASMFEATRVSASLDIPENHDWRIEEAKRQRRHALQRRKTRGRERAKRRMVTHAQKMKAFRQLHAGEGAFVIPNPWDAGTARILTQLGFKALATTSAGFAFSIGQRDSKASLTREQVLGNARSIVESTDLPVSADLEDGFGAEPEACAETIRMAFDIGLVGGSIEDATGDSRNPIYDFQHAVERIAAACEVKPSHSFVVVARADNFLYGRPHLDDTICRLQAFKKAGADVLYAPGLPNLDTIRVVCKAVEKPVNVVMGLAGPSFSVEELQAAGVKQISVGGAFARAALGEFLRAAIEVKDHGTFWFAQSAMPDAIASEYMENIPR